MCDWMAHSSSKDYGNSKYYDGIRKEELYILNNEEWKVKETCTIVMLFEYQ